MTRFTIIREDSIMIVDGFILDTLDLSSVPDYVHAVQWYGTEGMIQHNDGRPDEKITDTTRYDDLLQAHTDARFALENPVYTKEQRFAKKVDDILELNQEANQRDFVWNGHNFVADKESIQATQNQCLLMSDADPIPTPNGAWVLSDDSTLAMTVSEFKQFATAFYMRGSGNYGVRRYHINNITAMLDDPAATPSEIFNYDASGGWL